MPTGTNEAKGHEDLSVGDVMTREVVTLDMNDSLHIADDVMSLGRIRHTPVLDGDGAVAGILSQRDLFRGALARVLGYGEHAQEKILNMLLVKEVMSPGVVSVSSETPLREAARMMFEKKIGCVLVIDSGALVGILTEGDFVRLAQA